MTQRVLIELVLFLLPFAIFFLYRAAMQDLSVKDRWPFTYLIIAGGVLAGGGLMISALQQESERGLCTRAPYYENGNYIEGEKVPCAELEVEKEDRFVLPEMDLDGGATE